MKIREAEIKDLPEIRKIYSYAREFMKKTGNPNQWGDSRPDEKMILEDIVEKRSLLVTEDEMICGIFAFIKGPDPTYALIENGSWLNDEPYSVIHRVASNGRAGGVMDALLGYCEAKAGNIRIDTHEDNKIMQHILEKHGFKKCGIIYTDNGTPRIAYQKNTAGQATI